MMLIPPAAQVYIDRVDALSLRERAAVFTAVCIVAVASSWNGFLDPSLARQKGYTNTLAQKQRELVVLQAQLGALMQARAKDTSGLSHLDAQRRKLAELDKSIEDRQRQMVPPERMAALLTDMLKSSRNLEIKGVRSLAASPIPVDSAAGGGPASAISMYRHGVELTVAGQYLDLLNYLDAIEKMPVKIFWGALSIDAAQYPRNLLKLTVYTLSPEKKWLQI